MTPEPGQTTPDIPVLTGVRAAIRARPQLVLLPVLVFVVAALLAGLLRSPIHSATAQIGVTDFVTSSQTTPGFQEGVENVASAAAQMIDAEPVLDMAAAILGEERAAVAGRLSAEAVPQTPFVDVTGTGEDEAHAVETANAGARALTDHLTELSALNPAADALGERYQEAARDLASAETRLRAAQAAFDAAPTPATRERLVNATAVRDDARLQADAIGSVYQASLRDGAAPSNAAVVATATTASSDRLSTALTYLVVALIAGAMLGVSLAVLMARDTST